MSVVQRIRIADNSDWSAISRISAISGYMDYINEIGERYLESGQILLLERDEILGFLKMEELPDNSLWLSGVRVDPAYRRQGIAESLTEAAEIVARERSLSSLRMMIYSDNSASLRLAEKRGYTIVEKFRILQGGIDLANFDELDPIDNTIVNVGWKFIRANHDLPKMGRFLSDDDAICFTYSDEHFRFIQPISGKFRIGESDESTIFIASSLWSLYDDALLRQDFEEAYLFERSSTPGQNSTL